MIAYKDYFHGVWLEKQIEKIMLFRWLGLALLVALVARIVYAWEQFPLLLADSPDYVEMADWLWRGDFSQYQGKRLPGYALVLVLCGQKLSLVWWFQSLGGMAVVGAVYFLARFFRLSSRWSGIMALFVGITPSLVILESIILTESVSVFGVVFACVLLVQILRQPDRCVIFAGGLGSLWAWLVLTRPVLIPMPLLWCMVLLGWRRFLCGSSWLAACKMALLVGLPSVLAIGSWMVFNWRMLGEPVVNKNATFGMVNHTVWFMELAHGPDRPYADIYVNCRERYSKEAAAIGSPTVISFYALRECQEKLGGDLHAVFRRLNRQLIQEHPWLYLKSVFRAWVNFWRASLIWYPEVVRPSWLAVLIQQVWCLFKALWLFVNFLFVLVVPWWMVRGWRHLSDPQVAALWLLYATVWGLSIVQALFEYGENARYAMPIIPVVLIVTVASRWSNRLKNAGDS